MYSNKKCKYLTILLYKTNTRIKSFNITKNDILSIIKLLDPGKAYGCDNVSIKRIQIYNEVITMPMK